MTRLRSLAAVCIVLWCATPSFARDGESVNPVFAGGCCCGILFIFVGIPILWGVWITLQKTAAMF